MIGRTLGPYTVIEKLGEGGMGEVYKAHQHRLERMVAIKVLRADCLADSDRRRRFLQEARAASALNHPGIVIIHDLCCEDGIDFIVMELVDGRGLDKLIPARGMPVDQARTVAVGIADPLARAHQAGIVHRDIKPANIMLTGEGVVKILDFGLAKLSLPVSDATDAPTATLEGVIAGTPAYMSPEQAEGRAVDARSDIFSFGIVLYQMLTGRLPFLGGSTASIVAAVLRDEPPAPTGDASDLGSVAMRCMRKAAAGRYQSMAEVRQALDQQAPAVPAAPAERPPSIAVLPFANLSPEKDTEYFSDGLAEELLNALAKVPGLRVAARTSSFSFREKGRDTAAIGQALKVDHLLDGSVRRAANRVRVTAQLIQVSDGFQLWSERYDREMTDIFAIQDDIAQAIVGTLRVRLGSKTGERLVVAPTSNIEAYNLYLKGNYHRLQRTQQGYDKAFECYQAAIAAEPLFAPAHAGLSMYYTGRGVFGWASPREISPAARMAVERALDLDSSLAEAHRVKGVIHAWHEYDWPAAEREFLRALQLEPNSAIAHWAYGYCMLTPVQRFDEALDHMTQAVELDPLAFKFQADRGAIYIQQRQYDRARAQFREVLDSDPNEYYALFCLGWTDMLAGRPEQALPALEKAVENSGRMSWMLGPLGAAYALAGRQATARRIVAELETRARDGYVPRGTFAEIHAALDDRDRAFAELDRAVEDRDTVCVQWLPTVSLYDPLRADPRFDPLLRKMRLK